MSESLWEPVVSWVRQHMRRAKPAWASVLVVALVAAVLVGWGVWKLAQAHYLERFEAQQVQLTALREDVARLQTRPPASIGPVDHPASPSAPATGEPVAPVRREVARPASKKLAESPAPPTSTTPPPPQREPSQGPSRVEVPPGGISAPNGVVSVNQQGGITTGSLNVNMPNPALLTVPQGEIMRAVLASVTAKPTEVSLGHHLSDGASSNVARQLGTVLTQVAWKFSYAALPVSADGVLIEAEQGLAAAQALHEALRKAGLKSTFKPKGGLPVGYISVVIGPSY